MSKPRSTSHSSGLMRAAPAISSRFASVVFPAPASPHSRMSRPVNGVGPGSPRQDSRPVAGTTNAPSTSSDDVDDRCSRTELSSSSTGTGVRANRRSSAPRCRCPQTASVRAAVRSTRLRPTGRIRDRRVAPYRSSEDRARFASGWGCVRSTALWRFIRAAQPSARRAKDLGATRRRTGVRYPPCGVGTFSSVWSRRACPVAPMAE